VLFAFAPRDELQDLHKTWMLLGVFSPPTESGVMWSPVRSVVAPQ
jgi:hypothetical protein